jgi:hypothetical protein
MQRFILISLLIILPLSSAYSYTATWNQWLRFGLGVDFNNFTSPETGEDVTADVTRSTFGYSGEASLPIFDILPPIAYLHSNLVIGYRHKKNEHRVSSTTGTVTGRSYIERETGPYFLLEWEPLLHFTFALGVWLRQYSLSESYTVSGSSSSISIQDNDPYLMLRFAVPIVDGRQWNLTVDVNSMAPQNSPASLFKLSFINFGARFVFEIPTNLKWSVGERGGY